MLKKLKTQIDELARQAVYLAENTLTGDSYEKKREMALEFVVSNIPVCTPFKKIVAKILAKFIDEAIDIAFKCAKSLIKDVEQ